MRFDHVTRPVAEERAAANQSRWTEWRETPEGQTDLQHYANVASKKTTEYAKTWRANNHEYHAAK